MGKTGDSEGNVVGFNVGDFVVGEFVGESDGDLVGRRVIIVGLCDGALVGFMVKSLGVNVGIYIGGNVGDTAGLNDGESVGIILGFDVVTVGVIVGDGDGESVAVNAGTTYNTVPVVAPINIIQQHSMQQHTIITSANLESDEESKLCDFVLVEFWSCLSTAFCVSELDAMRDGLDRIDC